MPGVGGGGGQPPVMYTTGLTGQPGTVFVPSHVAGIPTGPHQQSVYHMNNQLIQVNINYYLLYFYIIYYFLNKKVT